MELTYHCKVTRQDRVQNIIDTVGLGQVVREKYIHTLKQLELGEAGRWVCITDTGVTIIKDELKQKVITIYITTYRELVMVYGGQRAIPTYLRKKVDRNQSLFTHKGKTIWK